MMQKLFRLALLALLALGLCCSASAEPRYPERSGYVTDAAAVLSPETLEGLQRVCRELEKETDAELYIVTVDFLDGASIASYCANLRDRWELDDEDALVLLAVGHDLYTMCGGEEFNEKVNTLLQHKLLTTHLNDPFMAQDYDAALRAFVPALIEECARAWGEDIDLRVMPGYSQSASIPDAGTWLQQRVERRVTRDEDAFSPGERDTGISPGKILLTIFLLTVIFGKKNNRGRRGCGCMPFSSVLAALGLWKLWKRD